MACRHPPPRRRAAIPQPLIREPVSVICECAVRTLSIAAFAVVFFSSAAFADTVLVAAKPGLMCTLAKALRVLTLPSGASRIGSSSEEPGDTALKISGGCVDLPLGATVMASSVRQRTSILLHDAGDGRGLRRYYVPNIDLRQSSPSDAPDPDGQCQALGNRMVKSHTLSGPVTNTEQFVTWRAACAGSPPTGPGLVALLCEGDVPHKTGAISRLFYWEKHAGSRISTGFLPCAY